MSLGTSVLICLSLILGHFQINGWILRLPCEKDAEFSVTIKDHALVNNVIGRYTVDNIGRCIAECMANYQCKSMNYKKTGDDNCELNSKIKQQASVAEFEYNNEWVYIATDYSSKMIGSFCKAMNPCGMGTICVDTCDVTSYKCMQCELNMETIYEQFCQHIITNIALGMPAMMSSQYDHRTPASRAVDGNLQVGFVHCAITKHSSNYEWWRVDLGRPAVVLSIAAKNRNCCLNRLGNFQVTVGNSLVDDGRKNAICFDKAKFTAPEQYRVFQCSSTMHGRYVSLFKLSTDILEICEVQVNGYFLP